jgi:hypothetical protein
MALEDNEINVQEALWHYLAAGGDEATWNNIKKALDRGTTPWEIKTGRPFDGGSYGASKTTFGGIESDFVTLPASTALSPQNPTAGFSNGFSYLILPDGVTTDLYFTIEMPEWWLRSTIGIYMEWANIHTATGTVRWDFEFKECDIGTESLSQSDTVQARAVDIPGVLANGGTTTTFVFSQNTGTPITFNPGPFASFYSLRISRLGGHANDTLAGPVGFITTNMTFGQ